MAVAGPVVVAGPMKREREDGGKGEEEGVSSQTQPH